MVDGQPLDDRAAHRQSHDVGPVDAQRVEDGDGVVRHVAERVVDTLELRGEPGVAVVEPHDLIALGRKLLTPRVGVVDALRPEPVDEQEGGMRGIAERLVIDLDIAVVSPSHTEILTRRSFGACPVSTWLPSTEKVRRPAWHRSSTPTSRPATCTWLCRCSSSTPMAGGSFRGGPRPSPCLRLAGRTA